VIARKQSKTFGLRKEHAKTREEGSGGATAKYFGIIYARGVKSAILRQKAPEFAVLFWHTSTGTYLLRFLQEVTHGRFSADNTHRQIFFHTRDRLHCPIYRLKTKTEESTRLSDTGNEESTRLDS